jgi:sugar/nucleoside kinase (ribokinase family)
MACLAVIGNISIDHRVYPDGKRDPALGGAALHITLAATRAGLAARPVSVIGSDLAGLNTHPRLATLDLTGVTIKGGASATFTLTYDDHGAITRTDAEYGVAADLTDHVLRHLAEQHDDAYHVCCRRPLDIARVLHALPSRPFSLDFTLPSAPLLIAAATPHLPRAGAVFVNSAEYQVLSEQLPIELLATLIVTDGPRPVRLFRGGRQIEAITPPATAAIEVTGAGDTLVGSFLAFRSIGRDETSALRAAVAAASSHTARPAIRLPGTE